MRKQREEEDFLEEYEDLEWETSSDESTADESSLDEPSSDGGNLVDNRAGENKYEGLGDNDGGVLLGVEERSFKPIWNEDTGGYLQGIRRCGSSATKKREKEAESESETTASQTRSRSSIKLKLIFLKSSFVISF